MTGWCSVRRKGQVETVVSAVSRGWEEYKRCYLHWAYAQRLCWSGERVQEMVKAWREGKEDSEELIGLEITLKKNANEPS